MYKRALVPLDGSAVGETILPFIAEIAGPLDMEILLVRVVPFRAVMLATDPRRVEEAVDRKLEAQQYLDRLTEELQAKGIRASAEVLLGEPVDELVAAARRAGADLIAMTTHGRSGLGRLLFGSVAEAVLRAAPLPVFLLRATEELLEANRRAGAARA